MGLTSSDNQNIQNQDALKKICKILKESETLKKSQCDITQRINNEFNELCKNREVSRDELNKNIKEINIKHTALKKRFDENMKNISKQIDAMNNEKNNKNENEEEGQYKILYETSMKKIKMLNDDIIDLKEANQSKKRACNKIKKRERKHID